MTTLPVSPTCPEAQSNEYPKLTNAALTALLSKPYGVEALRNIQQKNWDALQQQPDAIADLTHHCVICGMFCNRPQDLNLHMRTQHPTLLPNVMSKASQLNRAQASNSPCRFCDREFRRTHQCPVMMQAALLLVNTDDTGRSFSQPGDAVLCCDVCNMRFQELMQLHDHLHQIHRLEPQDRDPLRDMLTGTEPVCSHCLSMFADKPALRQHITLGQCRSFDPMRPPAEYPVAPDWQELIVSGTIAQLRQAPQKRMHLTLRCQFCHTAFQRTGDLSLHLQTVHSVLWHDSQSHVQLLMEASHTFGCLCNPMTNASGLQHICVALRQLGMMMQKMDQPLFLPWTFEQSHIQTFLQAVLHEPAGQQLRECLRLRQFVTLWTDPLLVQFLRTRCLQCGQSLHPAELREHLHRAHASVMNAQQTLMPQLLTAVGRENANDFHCDISISNISVQLCCSSRFCFKIMDAGTAFTAEDSEMLETFKMMGPLFKQERYERPEDGRESKKIRKDGRKQEESKDTQLLMAMGQLLLKVDAEQQALKRQDSWICFMQTEPQALLPSLIQKAAEWKQTTKVKQEPTMDHSPLPLRCLLTQHLAETLLHRVTKLAQCSPEDPLMKVALEQGLLTQEGHFPYQRWNAQAQCLKTTNHQPITIQRMIKYSEQMVEILKDPCATVKFHSLRPLSTEAIVPWMWQISMRSDDLQVLLTTLQGSTVWSLLGLSLKPHALHLSKQGQHLQTLMGKGQGKSQGKSKTKRSQ
ncbi:unnamed protein product [Cladocopium goreaui]|uniref:LINE-1 reverse transcriptase-like n=1 Tax=Cladocopium goreaui TaxID=2562237 RepID=A0A9P1C5S1_9DINO|nr:unnamed protein product [Cladocopium goreaui]